MLIPQKLKSGDEIRIVAPSRSLKIISEETRNNANKVFEKLGLKLTFSKNCENCDDFMSSSVEDRIEDLHEAFADKKVKAIFTVIGGYNCNQLLKYLDYELIKNIPIIYNADFGHTTPQITFPIGGEAKILAGKESKIIIIKH